MEAAKAKKIPSWYFPLLAFIIVALFCIIIVSMSISPESAVIHLPFINQVGKFINKDYHILGIAIYPFMVGSGLVVSAIISILRRREYGFTPIKAVLVAVLFFIQAIFGAAMLFIVEELISGQSISDIQFGGLSLFGTLYASLLFVPFLARFFRKPVSDFFDFTVPIWLILLCFTRFGCFSSGCCGAKEIIINGHNVFLPVQLFEVLTNLLIFSFCLWADDRNFSLGYRKYRLFPLMILMYSLIRYFIEFLRNNTVYHIGYTVSQIHCMIFITISLVWLFCVGRRNKSSVAKKDPI